MEDEEAEKFAVASSCRAEIEEYGRQVRVQGPGLGICCQWLQDSAGHWVYS